MKYADGQEVRLRDRVKLGQDKGGMVVCLIYAGEWLEDCPVEHWKYQESGVIIKFPLFGMKYYEELEPDIKLIERRPS